MATALIKSGHRYGKIKIDTQLYPMQVQKVNDLIAYIDYYSSIIEDEEFLEMLSHFKRELEKSVRISNSEGPWSDKIEVLNEQLGLLNLDIKSRFSAFSLSYDEGAINGNIKSTSGGLLRWLQRSFILGQLYSLIEDDLPLDEVKSPSLSVTMQGLDYHDLFVKLSGTLHEPGINGLLLELVEDTYSGKKKVQDLREGFDDYQKKLIHEAKDLHEGHNFWDMADSKENRRMALFQALSLKDFNRFNDIFSKYIVEGDLEREEVRGILKDIEVALSVRGMYNSETVSTYAKLADLALNDAKLTLRKRIKNAINGERELSSSILLASYESILNLGGNVDGLTDYLAERIKGERDRTLFYRGVQIIDKVSNEKAMDVLNEALGLWFDDDPFLFTILDIMSRSNGYLPEFSSHLIFYHKAKGELRWSEELRTARINTLIDGKIKIPSTVKRKDVFDLIQYLSESRQTELMKKLINHLIETRWFDYFSDRKELKKVKMGLERVSEGKVLIKSLNSQLRKSCMRNMFSFSDS